MEYFKDIPGYEGLYRVSQYGRVESLPRSCKEGRILKLINHSNGYYSCGLTKRSIQKQYKVHRLVMMAFRGESKLEVNHIDGNKRNNHLSNLEYCTVAQNAKHAFKLGLRCNKGANNSFKKLNDNDIINIRKLFIKGLKDKEIGEMYNVHLSTINLIRNNKTWTHI